LIGKLGPLEWVLNTPSHHRVHHARNPKYLDKNYAGTLIIWDRMFGTFQAEEEEPVYGLVKPLNSWNPLWANLHVWHELFRDAWLAPRLRDKFRIWFMPPGWRPEGLPPNPPPPEVSRETSIPFDTVSTRGMNAYAFVQFILTLAGAFGLLAAGGGLPRGSLMIAAVLVLWSLLNLGGIFECRSWVFASELARLSCIGVYGAYRLSGAGLPASVAWAVIFAVVASLCAFVYVWQRGNSPSPVVAARPETLGSELGFPQRAASEPEALGRSLSGTAAGRSR
jgi:hypothetical protein